MIIIRDFIDFSNELFEDVPEIIKNLIVQMLKVDHHDRITIKELNETLKELEESHKIRIKNEVPKEINHKRYLIEVFTV